MTTPKIGYVQTSGKGYKGYLRIRYIGGIPHYDFTNCKCKATQFLARHWDYELKHIFPKDKFVSI